MSFKTLVKILHGINEKVVHFENLKKKNFNGHLCLERLKKDTEKKRMSTIQV